MITTLLIVNISVGWASK